MTFEQGYNLTFHLTCIHPAYISFAMFTQVRFPYLFLCTRAFFFFTCKNPSVARYLLWKLNSFAATSYLQGLQKRFNLAAHCAMTIMGVLVLIRFWFCEGACRDRRGWEKKIQRKVDFCNDFLFENCGTWNPSQAVQFFNLTGCLARAGRLTPRDLSSLYVTVEHHLYMMWQRGPC